MPRPSLAAVAFATGALALAPAHGATLAEKARESGCVDKPVAVEGSTFTYKCQTGSGALSYFNVPGAAEARPADSGARRAAAATPTPSNFPRIDAATQKGRDEMRRKVLNDELAAEEKLLGRARADYANGAPAPLPEERASPDRYQERINRLRQSVLLHERNIAALKRELAASGAPVTASAAAPAASGK